MAVVEPLLAAHDKLAVPVKRLVLGLSHHRHSQLLYTNALTLYPVSAERGLAVVKVLTEGQKTSTPSKHIHSTDKQPACPGHSYY